jgi:phosphoribosylamine---glycine ligase
MKKVLIIGSGGREHALSWKLSQSGNVSRVFVAPGNGGTSTNVPIRTDDIDALIKYAKQNECLTIVGPEKPLESGIVNRFQNEGLPIFGPSKEAAMIETSKVWAKEFMKRNRIPTADFGAFSDPKEGRAFAASMDFNCVIKADGLADGKGVFLCSNSGEVSNAIDRIMIKKEFGGSGNKILVEERLVGIEASYIVITDGTSCLPMGVAQDHKRIYDLDQGPNTGGMGAYSPVPMVGPGLEEEIKSEIISRTVAAMRSEGVPFSGFLYAGLMITEKGPYVIEFNARMGDPEAQVIIPRMESDLYPYIEASVAGNLSSLQPIKWSKDSAVCVVLASEGYPSKFQSDEPVKLPKLDGKRNIIFHSGTKLADGLLLTSGGRVMGATALGPTLEDAANSAYLIADQVEWRSKYMRKDIARAAIEFLMST